MYRVVPYYSLMVALEQKNLELSQLETKTNSLETDWKKKYCCSHSGRKKLVDSVNNSRKPASSSTASS